MNSRGHGLGFKLLIHLVTGLWFAATSLVWALIFVPWSEDRFKGRGIDMPWIVPRAIWQFANELLHAKPSAYLPLVLISAVFGSLLFARTLYKPALNSSLVAFVFGGLAGLPTFATLVIVQAAIGEMQRPYPEVRGFLFLTFLGIVWGYWRLPTLMITYAASGWLLYLAKLIVKRLFASS